VEIRVKCSFPHRTKDMKQYLCCSWSGFQNAKEQSLKSKVRRSVYQHNHIFQNSETELPSLKISKVYVYSNQKNHKESKKIWKRFYSCSQTKFDTAFIVSYKKKMCGHTVTGPPAPTTHQSKPLPC
jgi:hypothetical protein